MNIFHSPTLKWKQSNDLDSNGLKLVHDYNRHTHYSIPTTIIIWSLYTLENLTIYMFSKWPLFRTTEIYKALKTTIGYPKRILHLVAPYIYDLITLARRLVLCSSKIYKYRVLLDSLGYVVHPAKSLFVKTQCIEYLGFVILRK